MINGAVEPEVALSVRQLTCLADLPEHYPLVARQTLQE